MRHLVELRQAVSWGFRRQASTRCSGPRIFPKHGFNVIPSTKLIEEERLPHYHMKNYYPTTLGDIIHGHYQVVAKLGFGTTSTVWLARDLR